MPDYRREATQVARRYGLNPRIFRAMIQQESGFREGLTSSAGARDIAQFTPATAREYGVTLGDNRASDDLDGAARYLLDNLKKYGTYERALSVYNSGKPDAYKDPNFSGGQTYNYVRSIIGASKAPRAPRASTRGIGSPTGGPTGPTYRTIPGVDNSQARRDLEINYFGTSHSPDALLNLAKGLQGAQDTPARRVRVRTPASASSPAQPPKIPAGAVRGGVTKFEGVQVAAWIAPILRYARKQGWKGKVTSGYRSRAQQAAIYNSGVRPAARPGTSNHEGDEFPRGAVDVSEAQQLARILARSPYGGKLKWAGAKDPVHFSYPHNGGY